jgi:hypothetical protein
MPILDFQPVVNAVLLTDTSDDSKRAKNYLRQRFIEYRELTNPADPYLQLYSAPTLFIRGSAYQGLEAIKQAVDTDPNLWI